MSGRIRFEISDTIAAVSTPYGKGGVALIRISGGDAVRIADRIFRLKSGKLLSECTPRKLFYGDISDPVTGEHIDDVMAVMMKAPATYTGEDTVEITCHGGILITRDVLDAALRAGARAAQAGEYTRRAFVNGRIALSEAESLGLMLDASSEAQLKLYRSGMNGRLHERVEKIYDGLCRIQSNIFACIDYPDEDLTEIGSDEMVEILASIINDIDRLIATFRTGRAVGEGIPAVICGRTNAGKSSLYNLMAGYDAAIVTEVEGTTRDVLKQNVSIGKVTLRLSDTAGLRGGAEVDIVESLGIERAKNEIYNAELVFAVFDGSKPLCANDRELLGVLKSHTGCLIAVINKNDLPQYITDGSDDYNEIEDVFGRNGIIRLSTSTGLGYDTLCDTVEKLYVDGSIDLSNDAVVINARQVAALSEAKAALESAVDGIASGLQIDMCCSDVEQAMISIGSIDGKNVSEDVVGAIFSRFCVGK